jgi:hypothetical protein
VSEKSWRHGGNQRRGGGTQWLRRRHPMAPAQGWRTTAAAVGCGASEGRVGGRMRFTWSASDSTIEYYGGEEKRKPAWHCRRRHAAAPPLRPLGANGGATTGYRGSRRHHRVARASAPPPATSTDDVFLSSLLPPLLH